MKILKERIKKDGKTSDGNIVRVDSFLNHQIDAKLMKSIGEEFAKRFKDSGATLILTIESSGIAVGVMTALAMDLPMVFAKKSMSANINKDVYAAKLHSYTKNSDYTAIVSKQYISSNDKVLILDDFLAMGEAVNGLMSIVEQAGASVAGVGIVIEKGFQQGGEKLRKDGIRLESLAIIDDITNGSIVIRE